MVWAPENRSLQDLEQQANELVVVLETLRAAIDQKRQDRQYPPAQEQVFLGYPTQFAI